MSQHPNKRGLDEAEEQVPSKVIKMSEDDDSSSSSGSDSSGSSSDGSSSSDDSSSSDSSGSSSDSESVDNGSSPSFKAKLKSENSLVENEEGKESSNLFDIETNSNLVGSETIEDEDGAIPSSEDDEPSVAWIPPLPDSPEAPLPPPLPEITTTSTTSKDHNSSLHEADDSFDDDDSSDADSEDLNELDALLEKDVEKTKAVEDLEVPVEVVKYSMIEMNQNYFAVLPTGWVKILHASGIPVYIHKPTRVVTTTMPYQIGKFSAKTHMIPSTAIPCLYYRKELEKAKEHSESQKVDDNSSNMEKSKDQSESQNVIHDSSNMEVDNVGKCPIRFEDQNRCPVNSGENNGGRDFALNEGASTSSATHMSSANKPKNMPDAKVIEASESKKKLLLPSPEVREYCSKLFQFKMQTYSKFRSWSASRRRQRIQREQNLEAIKKDIQENGQGDLPEGTQIITIPVISMAKNDDGTPVGDKLNVLKNRILRKTKKDWYINPVGKSTVCILHEYLQHSMKMAPTYKFSSVESTITPYCATVEVGGVDYGTGFGTSKKLAKSEAARITLELFVPDFKNVQSKNGKFVAKLESENYFDKILIEDPRVAELCNLMSEPAPYAVLIFCLQKNYGLGDTSIQMALNPTRKKMNIFTMKVNDKEVQAVCRNKRDGKQLAAQKLLQLLHPSFKYWGSLVRLYGSCALTDQKSKKEKESEVTRLQSRTLSKDPPSDAILEKLRQEMRLLHETKEVSIPIGKLTVPSVYSNLTNSLPQKIQF